MSQHTSSGKREKAVQFRLASKPSIKEAGARKFRGLLPALTLPILICLWLGGWLMFLIGGRGK